MIASLLAIIAGSVTSFLVVVLLLTLAGGVVAVVVRAMRKKMRSEAECPDPLATDNDNKTQNAEPNEGAYCYATTNKLAFTNPASATASFSAHMSEDDQCDVSTEEKAPITMNPEELYTVPNKVKSDNTKDKLDSQGSIKEKMIIAASSDNLYAKPDKSKKKGQRGQDIEMEDQWQDREEVKYAPIAPLPYREHKEAQEEGEEVGAGVLPQERQFDYAALDWDRR